MSLDDIKSLDVDGITHDDGILYIWATSPKLREALEVIDAWGFEYKTQMIWDKEHIGMGYWTRGRHEILLIATKGNPPAPKPEHRWDSVQVEARREHSRKPEWTYEMIEQQWGDAAKLEMFARTERAGWSTFGNETDTFVQ